MERNRYISSSSTTGVMERRHRSRSDKRVVSHSHDSFMRTNSNCSNISTVSSSVTTANNTTITNCNEDNYKGNNICSNNNASNRHPYHLEQKQKEQPQEQEEQTQKKVKEITESELSKTHSHALTIAQNKTNEMRVKLDENKLIEQIHKMEEEYAHLYGLYTSQQEQLQGMSTLREEAKLLHLHKTSTDESSDSISELGKYKELLCRINEELSSVHDLSVGGDESKLQARLHVNANMGERVNAKKVHNSGSSKHNINALSDELQTHILHISQRLRLLMLSERNKKQTIQSINSELESLKQKYTEPSKCNNNSMNTSMLNTKEIHQLHDKIEHCMTERDDAINSVAQVQQKLEMMQYQLERSNRRNGTLQREVEKMKKHMSESEQQWGKRIQEQSTGANNNCTVKVNTSSENRHKLSRLFVGKEFVILWRISPNEFVTCLEECINHVMTTFTQERHDKELHQINKCNIAQINAHIHDVEVIFTIEMCIGANTQTSESKVEMMQELEYLILHEEFHDLHNLALSYLTQYDDEQQEEMHEQLRNDDEAIRTLHEQLQQLKKKANNLAHELECTRVKQHDMEELVARTFDETEVALVDMQNALHNKEHELEQLHSQHKNEIDNLKTKHAKSLASEIEKMKKSISAEIAKCNENETNMRSASLLHRFQLHIPVHLTDVTSKGKALHVSNKKQEQEVASSEKEIELEEQKTMYNIVLEMLYTLFTTNNSDSNSNSNATSSTTRYFDTIQDLNVMKETICNLLLNYVATITQTIPRRVVSCKVIELNNTTQHITECNGNKQQELYGNMSHELLVEVDLMLHCTRNNENAMIDNVQRILNNINSHNGNMFIIFEVMKLYAHAREQVKVVNTKFEKKLLEQQNNINTNTSLQLKKYVNELQEMRRVMSLFLQKWLKEEKEGDAKIQSGIATLQRVKQLLLSCQRQNADNTSTLSSLLEIVNQDRAVTRTQCETLQTMIDKLNQNNAHMQLQVNKLNEQVKKSNFNSSISKISSGDNSFVSSMSAKLDVEKAKCKQLQEQLTKASAEKCTLQGQLKELEVDLTDFANIQSSLQEEISLLQRRLHAAEQDKEFLQYELNKTKQNVQSSIINNSVGSVMQNNHHNKKKNNISNENGKNVFVDAASATINNVNNADYNDNINKQQKGSINIESKNTSKGRSTEGGEEDAAASVTINTSFRSTNVEKTVTVYRSPIKTPPSSLSINTNKDSSISSNNNTSNYSPYSRPLPANQSNLYSSHGSSSQIMSHLYKRTHSSDSVLSNISSSSHNTINFVNNNISSSSSNNKVNTIKYASNTSKHTSPLTFTKSNSYTSGLSNKLSTTRPSRENSSNTTIEDNVIDKPSVYELSPFSVGNNMYNYSPTNSETTSNNNSTNKTNQNSKNDTSFNKNDEKEMFNKDVVGSNALKRSYTSISSISANNSINKSNSNNNTNNNVSKAPALRHRFSRS